MENELVLNVRGLPGASHLLRVGESLPMLYRLPPDEILRRWFNYHLAKDAAARRIRRPRQIANFGRDLADSECYLTLLARIAPRNSGVSDRPFAMQGGLEAAGEVLMQAQKIVPAPCISAVQIAEGCPAANAAFVAQLFSLHPALPPHEDELLAKQRQSRPPQRLFQTRADRTHSAPNLPADAPAVVPMSATERTEYHARVKAGLAYSAHRRPQALVIANDWFRREQRLTGVKVDARLVSSLLVQLGFDVQLEKNLSGEQIRAAVGAFVEKFAAPSCPFDAAFVYVSTHGLQDGVLGTDSAIVPLEDITNALDGALGLKGKAKIVVVDACRNRFPGRPKMWRPPPDQLLIHATRPGTTAGLNWRTGSWFTRPFAEVVAQHAHGNNIVQLMALVRAELQRQGNGQQSRQTNTLKKQFFFVPPLESEANPLARALAQLNLNPQ